MKTFDLLVIGSGPAGLRAVIQAAKLGKCVGIVERRSLVGGVSVHTGTIPSKTIREAVLYLSGWRQHGFYGRSYRVKKEITAKDVMQRVEITLQHEVEVIQHQLFRNGVSILHGTAHFIDPHQISVIDIDGKETKYEAKNFLIAVGTQPYHPDNIPFNGESVMDSDDILNLRKIPRSMTVIGAGVIGIEYATIFNALDTEVTLVESRDCILDFVDHEIISGLIHHMRDCGIRIRLNEQVEHIETDQQRKRMITHLKSGKRLAGETVLYTAGRTGATHALKLENVGLQADNRGRLAVNNRYQTEVSHIYAAGDVIGFPSLAATSMEQGRLATCYAFNHKTHSHPELFPYGIYAVPEISMVGMTEQALQKAGVPHESGCARFRETARGQILGLREGMLKMLFSITDRRLLGVHIVGEGATELIHIGQAVLAMQGTLDYFVEHAFNYPTLAEAYKIAALDAWNRMALYEDTSVKNSGPQIEVLSTENKPVTILSATR